MFSLFLRPEDTSPSTSCLTPHMKHNHATLQTLHQQEPCRQEQHSLFKTKLISSIVSNHLYKCPDAYKSQTLIRAFSLVPHIGSYKHTCTVLGLCWATTIFFCSNLEWKMGHLAAWTMNNDFRPSLAKLVWCNLLNAHMLPPTGKLALAGSECFFEPSRSNFCIFPPGFCLILGLCWATTIFFCSNLEWKMGHLAAWHMNNDFRPCHMYNYYYLQTVLMVVMSWCIQLWNKQRKKTSKE